MVSAFEEKVRQQNRYADRRWGTALRVHPLIGTARHDWRFAKRFWGFDGERRPGVAIAKNLKVGGSYRIWAPAALLLTAGVLLAAFAASAQTPVDTLPLR